MPNKLKLALIYAWRPAFVILLSAVVIFFLLWFRLGDLPGGMNQAEFAVHQNLAERNLSLAGILRDPLYLPYNAGLYVLQKLGLTGPLAIRSLSALIGAVTIASFYMIVRRWHTVRMAIFGTALFASSSWFLFTARNGTPDIIYPSIIAVVIAGVWLQRSKSRRLFLSVLLFVAAMYTYIPGMVWFVVAAGIWQAKRIAKELERVPLWFPAVLTVGGLVLLAPLGWALFQDNKLLLPWLGLPEQMPSLMTYLRNIADIPLYLLWRGPFEPGEWLSPRPYLDIFSAVMLIIGLYWSWLKFRLDRVRIQAGVIGFGVLLMGLGGPVSLALILPFIYLTITAGMTLMLQQWFTVFPRNPIARATGALLLSAAILMSISYHLRHYFVAWPNMPETRAAYRHQPQKDIN